MSDKSAFPLDAEQIVRGLGFLAARWIDRTRRPGDDAMGFGAVTLALADAMGVAMPVERCGSRRRLLPYGSDNTVTAEPEGSDVNRLGRVSDNPHRTARDSQRPGKAPEGRGAVDA